MVLVKQIGFKCVIQVHFLGVNLKCVVLENFHTPPTERIGNSQGQGFSKAKNMSYSMDVTLFFCFVFQVSKEMDRWSSQKSFKRQGGLPWRRQDLSSRLQSSFKRNQKQSSPHTM